MSNKESGRIRIPDYFPMNYEDAYAVVGKIAKQTPESLVQTRRYAQFGRHVRTLNVQVGEMVSFQDERLRNLKWINTIAKPRKELFLLEVKQAQFRCVSVSTDSSNVVTQIHNGINEYQFLLKVDDSALPPVVSRTGVGQTFRNVAVKENEKAIAGWMLMHAKVLASQLSQPIVLDERWVGAQS